HASPRRQVAREAPGRQAASAQAGLERALADAEERHASEIKAGAGRLATLQSESEARLAQAAAVKDAMDRQLRETEGTLERVRPEGAAETATGAWRFAKLETKLITSTETVQTLERRLTEAADALQSAERRAESERLESAQQAAQRQSEF